MTNTIRLDKYLSDMSIGSRSQVKKFIKKEKVEINHQVVTDPSYKVNTIEDKVYYDGKLLTYSKYIYLMLNKPVGVVSATRDNVNKTVIDLIDKKYGKDLFPVGRLDKDTEGLLLITNDGKLSHELLSPKKKVAKTYYAVIDGKVTEKEVSLFEKGIVISDNFTALPAHLEILETIDEREKSHSSRVNLTIYEGKFHQVKRMFEALDMRVTYLKRISMGSLDLDDNLKLGEYRHLTETELEVLCKAIL